MKAKILVIEDNEQNMYLVTFILRKARLSGVSGKKWRRWDLIGKSAKT